MDRNRIGIYGGLKEWCFKGWAVWRFGVRSGFRMGFCKNGEGFWESGVGRGGCVGLERDWVRDNWEKGGIFVGIEVGGGEMGG